MDTIRYCTHCGTRFIDVKSDKHYIIIQDCVPCGTRYETVLNDPRSDGRDILYTYHIVQEGVK